MRGIGLVHKALRLAYGLALIAILFTPFGAYHSRIEPYIVGLLWGFHLPVGYVAFALGMLVIFSPRTILARNRSFAAAMVVIGVLLLLSFYLWPRYFSINLMHGTSFSSAQIDIDNPTGNLAVFYLALFSLSVGLAARLIAAIKRFSFRSN